MANRLQKLRKENNKNDELLFMENRSLMTDMVVYLRSSNLCNYDIEGIRRDLFAMIYEAQMRGETAGHVIGDDYKSFCRELMRNGRKKDFYEKLLEWAHIIVTGVGALYAIEVVFSGFLFEQFIHGNFRIAIDLGFAVTVLLTIAGAAAVYQYFTKYSFELGGNRRRLYFLVFIAGFTLYFAGSIMVRVLLKEISLFQINVFIPVAFLAASYLIVKRLDDRNSNAIAELHNE